MDQKLYCRVVAWLEEAVQLDKLTNPPTELCAQVAQSPAVQSNLLVAVAAMFGLQAEQLYGKTCRECEDDMAAFIDLEIDYDIATALQHYPHVWWALWRCPDFFEVYAMTRDLALRASPLSGLREAQTEPLPPLHPHPFVTITREMLAQIFTVRRFLMSAMGGEDDTITIAEESGADYTLMVRLHEVDTTTWEVIAFTRPPVTGTVVLTYGDSQANVPLNETGVASTTAIPVGFLTSATGADLTVRVVSSDMPGMP